MKEFWNKIKPSRRKIMQLYFALLFNSNIQGFFTGKIYANHDPSTTTKQFCAPGINCYSCPGATPAPVLSAPAPWAACRVPSVPTAAPCSMSAVHCFCMLFCLAV